MSTIATHWHAREYDDWHFIWYAYPLHCTNEIKTRSNIEWSCKLQSRNRHAQIYLLLLVRLKIEIEEWKLIIPNNQKSSKQVCWGWFCGRGAIGNIITPRFEFVCAK